VNNLQYIYFGLRTTLAASLLFSTIICVGSFAAYGLTVENSDIAAKTEELLTEESNTITLQKQPQVIAQTGSSEVTGDTFGDINKLRQDLLIDPIVIEQSSSRSAPGSSAGTPTAYGAGEGQGYVGAGLYLPLDRGRSDGSVHIGVGSGDPVKSVAIEVSADITSIGTQDFGDSGQVGLKLHKYFEDGTAVAVGWSNAIKWGDSKTAQDTVYGVVTRAFDLQPNAKNRLPLTVSLGVGTGSFRSEGDVINNKQGVNVFGSLGLRVIPSTSIVTSWTGNALNAGASIAPLKTAPIVINAVFTDLTNTFNNGVGFSLSSGYSFEF
jgi:hypothetical protein